MVQINIAKPKKMKGVFTHSMFISFPYDNNLVEIMRNLPQKIWNKEDKKWEVPANMLGKVLTAMQDQEIEITGEYFEIVKPEAKVPEGFEFKTKPFQHQIDGFNFGLANDRWFLADEQGLGKTKQVIDIAIAKKLQRGYKHCLIVCGVNGLKWNWLNEIETHSNEKGFILGQRYHNGKISIGSNADKLSDLRRIGNYPAIDSHYFIITNVESLRDKNIAEAVNRLCEDRTIGVVAVDEIHKCFDYDTLITTDIGTLKIGDIVKDQISCSVLSYNEITGENEWKRIADWHENVVAEQLLELQFETKSGIKIIKCTKGHKFFTKNRGWVRAEDLTSYDDIQEF